MRPGQGPGVVATGAEHSVFVQHWVVHLLSLLLSSTITPLYESKLRLTETLLWHRTISTLTTQWLGKARQGRDEMSNKEGEEEILN